MPDTPTIAGGGGGPHAASHVGIDSIRDATAAQKGLATPAQITKLDTLGVNQAQILYVGKHGNDANDGKTPDKSFITFAAAIAAAVALTPTTSNRICVKSNDGGNYTENLTVPSWVQISAPCATINGTHTLSDDSQFKCHRVALTAGTAFSKLAGSGYAYVDVERFDLTLAGNGLICTSGEIILQYNQLHVENGIGIGQIGAATECEILGGEIHVTGSGYGIVSATAGSKIAGYNAAIHVTGVGGTGILVGEDAFADLQIGWLDAAGETAYNVNHAAGQLNLFVNRISGTQTKTGTANVSTPGAAFTRVKTLGDGNADYSTPDNAITNEADWDTLEFHGVYTGVSNTTLPAGKTIRGIGSREECSWEFASVLTETVITVDGAGTYLENMTLKTKGGVNKQATISGSDVLNCNNVHWESGPGSTHSWEWENPTRMVSSKHTTAIGVIGQYCNDDAHEWIDNDWHQTAGSWIANMFNQPDKVIVRGGTYETDDNGVIFNATAVGAFGLFSGVEFIGAWDNAVAALVDGVAFMNCRMGGMPFGKIAGATTPTVTIRSTSGWGGAPDAASNINTIWDLDEGWVVAHSSDATLLGFERRVDVDLSGGDVEITLCPIAKHRGERSLIVYIEVDGGGTCKVTPDGAELINGSNSSVYLTEARVAFHFERNEANTEWLITAKPALITRQGWAVPDTADASPNEHQVLGVWEEHLSGAAVNGGTPQNHVDANGHHVAVNITTMNVAGTLHFTGDSYDPATGNTSVGDTEDLVISGTGWARTTKYWDETTVVLSSVGGLDVVLDSVTMDSEHHTQGKLVKMLDVYWTAQSSNSMQIELRKWDPTNGLVVIWNSPTITGLTNGTRGHRSRGPLTTQIEPDGTILLSLHTAKLIDSRVELDYIG